MKKVLLILLTAITLFADYFYVSTPYGNIYTRKVYIEGNIAKIFNRDVIRTNSELFFEKDIEYVIVKYNFIKKIKSRQIFFAR